MDTLSPYAQKGKITFIYALLEPDTNDVRYIGKSDNPKRRFQNHLTDKRKNHRTSWIKSLKNKGQEPLLIILEEVAFEIWQIRERHWISFYREKGADLVNMTDGGEGGYLGEEATARASLKKRGKKHTDEHKRKISEGCKGHFVSEGSKQRWAELGKNKSEETKRKIGEASKGRTLSQEARMKISEKLKGRGHPHTEETKRLLREKSMGNKSHLGHKLSLEAREKIAEANRKRFRRKGKDE